MTSVVPVEFSARIPAAFAPLFDRHRYKVFHGGRGSGKSHTFATALLIMAAQRKMRVLCTRELQMSIADSVHKLLCDKIEDLGLSSHYEVTQHTIRGVVAGSEFIFYGLKSNITKIKSLEGVDVVWVEEAQCISEESWRVLIPTIREEGSEIWLSLNRDSERDPTDKRFIQNPPPDSFVAQVNWDDNPFFPEVLRREKDYDYRVDPEAAAHVWGGQPRRITNAQVLRGRFVIDVFEPLKEWSGPYYGADWGFAVDPTALVRCWVDASNRTLYVEYEAYGVGVDIDDTPELFASVPESRTHTIRADNARPETISYMQRHGYPRTTAADKWPGSVEDGVEHLRSYAKIVIHPRCKHAAEEARLWSYKIDVHTGDVMPVLIPKHDHVIDSLRYALSPVIRRRVLRTDGYMSASTSTQQTVTRGVHKDRDRDRAPRLNAFAGGPKGIL